MTTRVSHRVVITGLGLVTPLGNDVESNWRALLAGRSGIDTIARFDASALPARIGGEVRGFEPGDYVERKDIKKMDRFTQYAIAAAEMAMADSALAIDRAAAD